MMRIVKWAMGLGVGVFVLMGAMTVVGQQAGAPAAALAPMPQAVATLKIETDKPVAKVSPTLYGLMTEEINYSYDGGLYGELVQDRTFLSRGDDTQNWIPVAQGWAKGSVARDMSTGPSAALPASGKMMVERADAADTFGVCNHGWWGVPVRPNTTYTGEVYAKGDAAGAAAKVRVSLVANDTGKRKVRKDLAIACARGPEAGLTAATPTPTTTPQSSASLAASQPSNLEPRTSNLNPTLAGHKSSVFDSARGAGPLPARTGSA